METPHCIFITGSTSSFASDTVHEEAKEGLCAETRKSVGAVVKVMEAVNDNGKSLSDSLLDLAELKLEESSTYRLSKKLEKQLESELDVQVNQLLSIIMIKIQKRRSIKEACDKITYLNHGERKEFCIDGDHDSNIDSLISHKQQDICSSPTFEDVLIPVKSTNLPNESSAGAIDLNELLQDNGDNNNGDWKTNGEVLFTIPGEDWMVEHGKSTGRGHQTSSVAHVRSTCARLER